MSTDSPDLGQLAPQTGIDDQQLIRFLHERDILCPLCQYNLRNLTTTRCPECGNELQLSVALSDPYLIPWLALAIALCGSAGMGLIFLCIVLRAGLPHQGDLLTGVIVYFMLTIPVPVILIRSRRRFQQLPRPMQWLVANLVVFITLVAVAILCGQLR